MRTPMLRRLLTLVALTATTASGTAGVSTPRAASSDAVAVTAEVGAGTADVDAVAAGDARPSAHRYVGRWNYDQPDRETWTNIAEIRTPDGSHDVPQVGYLVVVADGNDRVVARTDVGCTWRFSVDSSGLDLDPAGQTCHNPTTGATYAISEWHATVRGNRMYETITETGDDDVAWVLDNGVRTRVAQHPRADLRGLAGTWAYDPADPDAGTNMRITISEGPDGIPVRTATREEGVLVIDHSGGSWVSVTTADGCQWLMQVHGGTAHLDPAIQTCTRSAQAAVTMRHWMIAFDGRSLAMSAVGTDATGADFTVGEASLHRAQR